MPNADAVTVSNQRRAILSGLVRAELLAQQGAKIGVDRSPEYLLALHDAQRRVLAGLTEEKIASAGIRQASPEEVRNVVSGNPGLFSKRALLVYEEVVIPGVDTALMNSMASSIRSGASLDRLLDMVKAKGLAFRRSMKTLTSDQIQPAFLRVFSGSKPKVPLLVRVDDKYSMILMLHSLVPAPVEDRAATVAAARMIEVQQRNAAISKKMTEVLDASDIRYFGEFRADSAGAKSGLAKLPEADAARNAGIQTHRFRLAVALGISSMGAVLLLFISRAVFSGIVLNFSFRPMSKNRLTPILFQ